jgi:hypothetical protein
MQPREPPVEAGDPRVQGFDVGPKFGAELAR